MMTILSPDLISQSQTLAETLHQEGRNDDAHIVRTLLQAIESTDKTKYLTTGQVAQRVGVSRQTIVNWIKKGLLPGVRLGGRMMVPSGILDRFTHIEAILDALDVEREPGQVTEVVELLERSREGWTWVGKED